MEDAGSVSWLEAEVPGAAELIAWFGRWPSFHDAEVTAIELSRSGRSRVSVHTFEMTRRVNSNGQYVIEKHVTVVFALSGLRDMELTGFNNQNVLSGVSVLKSENGYDLVLDGIYGVGGSITAEAISIELIPGAPPDSQYRAEALP